MWSPLIRPVSPGSRISTFLQHLTNDHLDVLVVDRHALQSVNFLDFVDQEVGQLLDAQDAQDVVRIRIAVDDVLAADGSKSPSCTAMCLPLGIRNSTASPWLPSASISG
jgi:hypothetical protein